MCIKLYKHDLVTKIEHDYVINISFSNCTCFTLSGSNIDLMNTTPMGNLMHCQTD